MECREWTEDEWRYLFDSRNASCSGVGLGGTGGASEGNVKKVGGGSSCCCNDHSWAFCGACVGGVLRSGSDMASAGSDRGRPDSAYISQFLDCNVPRKRVLEMLFWEWNSCRRKGY